MHKNSFARLPWPKHRNGGELLCGKQKLILQFPKKLCHIVNIAKFAQKRRYFLQFRNLIADLQKNIRKIEKFTFLNFFPPDIRLIGNKPLDGEYAMHNDNLPELLSPKVDVIFKLLFGDERYKDLTINFISAVLGYKKGELENIEKII